MVFHFPVAFNTLYSLLATCTYPYCRIELSTDGHIEGDREKSRRIVDVEIARTQANRNPYHRILVYRMLLFLATLRYPSSTHRREKWIWKVTKKSGDIWRSSARHAIENPSYRNRLYGPYFTFIQSIPDQSHPATNGILGAYHSLLVFSMCI